MKRLLVISLVIAATVSFSSTSFAKTEFLVQQSEYEVIEGVKYTTSHWDEFVWGFTRPFHLYNTDQHGVKELLPFYLEPMKEGGILSFMNPDAWINNRNLTFGSLTADIALIMLLML